MLQNVAYEMPNPATLAFLNPTNIAHVSKPGRRKKTVMKQSNLRRVLFLLKKVCNLSRAGMLPLWILRTNPHRPPCIHATEVEIK